MVDQEKVGWLGVLLGNRGKDSGGGGGMSCIGLTRGAWVREGGRGHGVCTL